MFSIISELFSNFKMYFYVAGAVALAMLVGYFFWMQHQVTTLNQQLGSVTTQLQQTQQTVNKLNNQIIVNQKLNTDYNNTVVDNSKKGDDLSKLFASHDLNAIGNSSPEILEKAINDGTKKAFDYVITFTSKDNYLKGLK